jgi:hypothetical protein
MYRRRPREAQMEQRFDRLEQMIGELGGQVRTVETALGARIDGVETALGARIDGVETSLGVRIDGVDEKLGGLSGELRSVETRLRGHIEDVEAHLTSRIDQKVDALSLKVGGLHEDVKADFKFSLEAHQGLKEQMEAGFAKQEDAFRDALAPLHDAIRRANELREREAAG